MPRVPSDARRGPYSQGADSREGRLDHEIREPIDAAPHCSGRRRRAARTAPGAAGSRTYGGRVRGASKSSKPISASTDARSSARDWAPRASPVATTNAAIRSRKPISTPRASRRCARIWAWRASPGAMTRAARGWRRPSSAPTAHRSPASCQGRPAAALKRRSRSRSGNRPSPWSRRSEGRWRTRAAPPPPRRTGRGRRAPLDRRSRRRPRRRRE